MPAEELTIGKRIRACRRFRGMTLQELADLSGLSKSFLSMVENGQRTIDRRSHLDAIADVLQVSLSEITGQPSASVDRASIAAHAAVPALRVALMDSTLDDPPEVPARPLPDLTEDMRAAAPLRRRRDYARLGKLLPDVITELHVIASTGSSAQRAEALRLLIQACQAAGFMLKYLGYADLAAFAAERARDAAERLDDPAWTGVAEFMHSHALMSARARSRALRTSVRAAERLEHHLDDGPTAEMYGMLHLTAALANATLSQDSTAWDHLDEAAQIAARTGECPAEPLHMGFGPTNVGFWRVAVALELGEPDKAVEAAREVEPGRLGAGRQAAYWSDVGRALAQIPGKQREAVKALRTAERLAPQMVRANPMVRDTVATMLNRARAQAGDRDLRGLAYRMGIPH